MTPKSLFCVICSHSSLNAWLTDVRFILLSRFCAYQSFAPNLCVGSLLSSYHSDRPPSGRSVLMSLFVCPVTLQYRADPALVDAKGRNCLHVACAYARAFVDPSEVSPLDHALGRKSPEGYLACVRILLEGWADYIMDWCVACLGPAVLLQF